jgi:hypothetical protein
LQNETLCFDFGSVLFFCFDVEARRFRKKNTLYVQTEKMYPGALKGVLLRDDATGKIFVNTPEGLRHIPSMEVLNALYNPNTITIEPVVEAEVPSNFFGPPLPTYTRLVKTPSPNPVSDPNCERLCTYKCRAYDPPEDFCIDECLKDCSDGFLYYLIDKDEWSDKKVKRAIIGVANKYYKFDLSRAVLTNVRSYLLGSK